MKTLSLLLLTLFVSHARAAAPAEPLNFHEVERGIYRGASPGPAGIFFLKNLGVKTILDLDNDSTAAGIEKNAAAQEGLKWIALPMSGFWTPKTATVNAALQVMANPALRPLYIHCKHGQDRTGLVVGLYRVEDQHWQPGHAYEEMKALGFHPMLVFLNHFFEGRTGFED